MIDLGWGREKGSFWGDKAEPFTVRIAIVLLVRFGASAKLKKNMRVEWRSSIFLSPCNLNCIWD